MLFVCVLLVHAHCSNWRERDGVRHNLWNMSWVRFELMILWWNPVRGFLVIAVTWACTCCIRFICSVGLIAWDHFTVCDTNLTSLLHLSLICRTLFIYSFWITVSCLHIQEDPCHVSGGSLSRDLMLTHLKPVTQKRTDTVDAGWAVTGYLLHIGIWQEFIVWQKA